MKNILIVSLDFPPQIGGIATYVQQTAKEIANLNNKVFVYAPEIQLNEKDKNNNKDKFKNYDQQFSFNVIRGKFYYKFFWPHWLKLYFNLKKIVKEKQIDLILVHHALPVGYVAYLLFKKYNIPYIVFSHGTDVVYNTRTKHKKRMYKMVLNSCQQIIFNSFSLEKRFLERMPFFKGKTRVMYPCPDIDFIQPPDKNVIVKLREQYALEGRKIILSISRLDEGKGFPHLIRIIPKILEQVPDLVWLIIGDGPKKDIILNLIRKNKLQNIVRFLGKVPHQEIKKFYYLADVFALFTHPDHGREEGLGLVFLEASASALPIVAGRSGGVEEAVVSGQTGYVNDVYKNLDDLQQALLKILTNSEYAKKLGLNGQQRIKEKFIWSKQIQKIADIL